VKAGYFKVITMIPTTKKPEKTVFTVFSGQ